MPPAVNWNIRLMGFAEPEVAGGSGQELGLKEPLVIFQGGDGLAQFGLKLGLGLGAAFLDQLGDFGLVEIQDGGELLDGLFGIFLGRRLEVFLGLS